MTVLAYVFYALAALYVALAIRTHERAARIASTIFAIGLAALATGRLIDSTPLMVLAIAVIWGGLYYRVITRRRAHLAAGEHS